ncbi:unknown [Clostridium sp. CAG:242]|nr:unknown [Clostridium sp. CAG:242]
MSRVNRDAGTLDAGWIVKAQNDISIFMVTLITEETVVIQQFQFQGGIIPGCAGEQRVFTQLQISRCAGGVLELKLDLTGRIIRQIGNRIVRFEDHIGKLTVCLYGHISNFIILDRNSTGNSFHIIAVNTSAGCKLIIVTIGASILDAYLVTDHIIHCSIRHWITFCIRIDGIFIYREGQCLFRNHLNQGSVTDLFGTGGRKLWFLVVQDCSITASVRTIIGGATGRTRGIAGRTARGTSSLIQDFCTGQRIGLSILGCSYGNISHIGGSSKIGYTIFAYILTASVYTGILACFFQCDHLSVDRCSNICTRYRNCDNLNGISIRYASGSHWVHIDQDISARILVSTLTVCTRLNIILCFCISICLRSQNILGFFCITALGLFCSVCFFLYLRCLKLLLLCLF